MLITTNTTLANIVTYIETTPTALEDLQKLLTVIEDNDTNGRIDVYSILDISTNYLPLDTAAVAFALAIITVGYPKNGNCPIHYWRYPDIMESLGITDTICNSLNLANFNLSTLTKEQLALLLPTRCKNRELKNRNNEQKKQSLKNIKLDEFSFKLFQNTLNNKSAKITIKDGMEYFSKLKNALADIDRAGTASHSELDIYYRWAAYLYSKIRNPNADVDKIIKGMQTRGNYTYHHYLPTVYLTSYLSNEILETLVDHENVVLPLNAITNLWELYFKGKYSNILNLFSTYYGYDEVLVSTPELYLHKQNNTVLTSNSFKLYTLIQTLRYLIFKEEILARSKWLTKTLDYVIQTFNKIKPSDYEAALITKADINITSQVDFLHFHLANMTIPVSEKEPQ